MSQRWCKYSSLAQAASAIKRKVAARVCVCVFRNVRRRSLQQCALLHVLWFLRCCTWLWPSSLPPSTARALPASIWAPVILAQRPRYPVARATGAVREATRTGSQFLGQGRSVSGGRRSASKWIGKWRMQLYIAWLQVTHMPWEWSSFDAGLMALAKSKSLRARTAVILRRWCLGGAAPRAMLLTLKHSCFLSLAM